LQEKILSFIHWIKAAMSVALYTQRAASPATSQMHGFQENENSGAVKQYGVDLAFWGKYLVVLHSLTPSRSFIPWFNTKVPLLRIPKGMRSTEEILASRVCWFRLVKLSSKLHK
jgi:hypothetical protein